VWANLKAGLVTYLTEVHTRRAQDERTVVLKARIVILAAAAQEKLAAMSISRHRPSISDVCAMPEYCAILESPSNQKITTVDFVELLNRLSEHAEKSRKSNMELLLRLLPSMAKQKGNKEADTSSLKLCTTFFRCHSCREPISYPRILSHACLLSGPRDTEKDVDLISRACPDTPWIHGIKGVVFDTEASSIMNMLVKLCGGDPKTLTSAMMDGLDSRFECLRCHHPRNGRLVMAWRTAVIFSS
jgi:hypothetical protein